MSEHTDNEPIGEYEGQDTNPPKHLKHQYCQENCPANPHEDDCPYNYGHNCSCLPSTQSDKEQTLVTIIANLYLDGYRYGKSGVYPSKPKQQAYKALTHLIAEETNTARISELEELLHFKKGEVLGLSTIQDKIIHRLATLKANKEKSR